MRKVITFFNWPMVLVWGGSISLGVFTLIMFFKWIGPIIGRALNN